MNPPRLDSAVIATNLGRAMADRDIGVRDLSKAIREKLGPDARGTSYGTLQKYRQGRVRRPRVDVLEAVAEALHLRPEWLIWNEGAPTLAEEYARQQGTAARNALRSKARSELIRRVEAAVEVELPRFRQGVFPHTWSTIWDLSICWIADANFLTRHPHLRDQVEAAAPDSDDLELLPDLQAKAASEVAAIIRRLADAAGVSLDELTDHQLHLYVAATSVAVQVLITHPKRFEPSQNRTRLSTYLSSTEA